MATTIDKYVLETSVTGLDDIKSANKEITSLGTNIDTVGKKNLSFKINTSGFAALEKSLGNIATSFDTISKKTITPKINTVALDALTNSIGTLIAKIDQGMMFRADTSQLTKAKNELDKVEEKIDKVNNKPVNIKSQSEGFLGTNLKNIGDAFSLFKGNIIGLAIGAAATAAGALAKNTVELAGKLTDLSVASGVSTSRLNDLRSSIIKSGGEADDYNKVVDKLIERINEAASGNVKAIETFKDLNVPIKEANGTMRNTTDILTDSIKALGNVSDENERAKKTTDLLDKSLRQIDWKGVTAGFDPKMEASIEKVDKFGEKWDIVKGDLSDLGLKTLPVIGEAAKSLATPFLDLAILVGTAFTGITNGVSLITKKVDDFLQRNAGLVKMADLMGKIATAPFQLFNKAYEQSPAAVKVGIGAANIGQAIKSSMVAKGAAGAAAQNLKGAESMLPIRPGEKALFNNAIGEATAAKLRAETAAAAAKAQMQMTAGTVGPITMTKAAPGLHRATADVRAKKAEDERMAGLMGGYKSRAPTNQYAASQFGTPKPKAGGGGGGADDAKREAEAREKARAASDAQLRNVVALSQMTTQAAEAETKLLGLNESMSNSSKERLAIESNLKKDLLKIDEEITREKEKGAKADSKILTNLETEKVVVTDMAVQLLAQQELADKKRKTMEDQTDALTAQYDAVMALGEIDDSETKSAAIQKEIDKHKALVDQYKGQYDALVALGEEQGLLSDAYLTSAENFSAYNTTWMQAMDAQQLKIGELRQAEEDRAESFASSWDDAIKKMVDSFTPAQQGAQAFNNLWGNIQTSISSSISTGRFEFAKFRDAVIADIASMMIKAAASNLIGRILGTVVSAAVAPSSSIPGDKGGSAIFPRAGGGSVGAGQPYMVGERGPELFMPGQNGTIIPNRNLQAESKPQVVNNYNYNVSAVDGQSVARFFLDNRNMVAAANRQASKERS